MSLTPGWGVSCLGSWVSWVYDIGNSVVLGVKNLRASTVATVALGVPSSTYRSNMRNWGRWYWGPGPMICMYLALGTGCRYTCFVKA